MPHEEKPIPARLLIPSGNVGTVNDDATFVRARRLFAGFVELRKANNFIRELATTAGLYSRKVACVFIP